MLNSVLRSPSKRFVGALVLALSLGITTAFYHRPNQSINRAEISTASVFSNPTARRSQNVEISPNNAKLSNAHSLPTPPIHPPQILPDPRRLSEVEAEAAVKPFNSISQPLSQARGSGRQTLRIHQCNGTAGNANFWAGDTAVGIISQGTVVELTGKESGEWIEAIAPYWPNDKTHPETGQFWINKCWL